MIVQCAWCKKWLKGQPITGDEPISHGICEDCLTEVKKETIGTSHTKRIMDRVDEET